MLYKADIERYMQENLAYNKVWVGKAPVPQWREGVLAANIAAIMLTDALASVEWVINLASFWFKEKPVKCIKFLSLFRIKVHLETRRRRPR